MPGSTVLEPPDPGFRSPVPPRRPPMGGGGGGGGDDEEGPKPNPQSHAAILAMWIGLAPVFMLFMAFVSTYVVRRGLGSEWTSNPVPQLLWANTVVLLFSSLFLERFRTLQSRHRDEKRWMWAAFAAGVLFLVGQIVAWRDWLANGVEFNSTTYASFFYLLTGTHAAHVLGGLLGLLLAIYWSDGKFGASRIVAAKVAAIFWHFLGILWLGLFLLLAFWR